MENKKLKKRNKNSLMDKRTKWVICRANVHWHSKRNLEAERYNKQKNYKTFHYIIYIYKFMTIVAVERPMAKISIY